VKNNEIKRRHVNNSKQDSADQYTFIAFFMNGHLKILGVKITK
jgi:hypothetical protein